jgi:hypothetical protein
VWGSSLAVLWFEAFDVSCSRGFNSPPGLFSGTLWKIL